MCVQGHASALAWKKISVAVLEQWLLYIFGKDAFTSVFSVLRGHKTTMRLLTQGIPPRSMLAKLLNYKDKDLTLKYTKGCKEVLHNGAKVSFFPDFSAEVQNNRANFSEVKRHLQRLQMMGTFSWVVHFYAKQCF